MILIKSFYEFICFLIKKFVSHLTGREIKVVKLDKTGEYKKIKIKIKSSGYKDFFLRGGSTKTAIVILLLIIFLIFLYVAWGTWSIPHWLYEGSDFLDKY